MKSLLVISAALLFLGLFNLPIGYYTILRIVVTIGAIGVVIKEYENGLNFWVLAFGGIAIIFNPLIPVYLNDKSAWMPIDIICGVLFLVKSFTTKQ
jgi:hypothetical protein